MPIFDYIPPVSTLLNPGDPNCKHLTIVQGRFGECWYCHRRQDFRDPDMIIRARQHVRKTVPLLTGVTVDKRGTYERIKPTVNKQGRSYLSRGRV